MPRTCLLDWIVNVPFALMYCFIIQLVPNKSIRIGIGIGIGILHPHLLYHRLLQNLGRKIFTLLYWSRFFELFLEW